MTFRLPIAHLRWRLLRGKPASVGCLCLQLAYIRLLPAVIRAEPGEPVMIPLVIDQTVSAPSRLLSYGDVLYFMAHTLGIYLCPVHCRDLLQLLLPAWALVKQTLGVFRLLF